VVLLVLLGVAGLLILYLRRTVTNLQKINLGFVREKQAVYAFLSSIGEKMGNQLDLDGTLEAIVSFLVEMTQAQGGAAFLFDKDRKTLRARVLVGLFPPLQKTFDYALTKVRFLHQKIKKEPVPLGQGIIGETAASGEPVLIADARSDPRVPQTPGLEIRSVIATPLVVSNRVEGVFALVNREGDEPFTDDDLKALCALADQASVTIQMAKMYDAMAEKQRIEQELRIAQDFQRMLLPKECPEIPGIEIAAASRPALEVGGDFYDFFWLGPDRLGIVIADVSGKGVPGAFIMSMVRSIVRAESLHAASPQAVLERVNRAVLADTRENVFITMIYAILDLSRKCLTFARAGHEPLVSLSRADGGMRLLAPEGIALGLVDERVFSTIREQEVPLHDGDVAVLYTDGVIEAMNPEGEEYGQEHFLEMLRSCAEKPARQMVRDIVGDIRKFASGGSQSDDITLVVMKFDQLDRCAERAKAPDSAPAPSGGQEGNIETV